MRSPLTTAAGGCKMRALLGRGVCSHSLLLCYTTNVAPKAEPTSTRADSPQKRNASLVGSALFVSLNSKARVASGLAAFATRASIA